MGNTPINPDVPVSPTVSALGHKSGEGDLNIERTLAFRAVGQAALWWLVSKFGQKAKDLKIKFQVSLPSVDARASGDGIRYYQVVPPTERVNKNRIVDDARKGTVNLAVINDQAAREHIVDAEGATNFLLSPIIPTVHDVLDYINLAVFEMWSGGQRNATFKAYCETVGYKGMPILDENGKETYDSKNNLRVTFKQVSRSEDLNKELTALVEERQLTIPTPMDWQAFEMTKTQTRGTAKCPSEQFNATTCPSFSISLKQAELVTLVCKLHNLPLAFTGPATAADAPAEGSQPSSTTAVEPAA